MTVKRKMCSYAKKYKAIHKPTCGCEHCERKWNMKCRRKQH